MLEARFDAGVRGITVSRVEGHGGELETVETYRGTTVSHRIRTGERDELAVTPEPRTGEVGPR